MHECVNCGQVCDCDDEDTWYDIPPAWCVCECEDMDIDDWLDDDSDDS
jgi:hypothetical protein